MTGFGGHIFKWNEEHEYQNFFLMPQGRPTSDIKLKRYLYLKHLEFNTIWS